MASGANPFSDSPQQVQGAMSIVAALESQSKALSNLSMHSQRLSRQFERTVIQLRELQKIRCAQEKHDLDNLINIIEMYESKGETYYPSDNGFVFSASQISQHTRARNRERLIEEAADYSDSAASTCSA
jgi:cysteinyl-tRNA synthetase